MSIIKATPTIESWQIKNYNPRETLNRAATKTKANKAGSAMGVGVIEKHQV